MIRYFVVILLTGLVAGYAIEPSFGARLPDALQERLRNNNFNVLSVPAPANDMTLRTLQGTKLKLSSFRGKVIILNFWKIDCPPCSLEKPILENIHRKYANKGLEIIGVNLFDDEQRIRSYVDKAGLTFTCASDPDGGLSVRKQYLSSGIPTSFIVNSDSEAVYELPGVPTTYVIDRQGQIAGSSVGMIDWEQRPFIEFIETLLARRHIPRPESVAAFAEPAMQGPTSSGAAPRTGPRRMEDAEVPSGTSAGPHVTPGPAVHEGPQAQPSLPFGSPFSPPGPAQAPSSVVAPSVPSTGTKVDSSQIKSDESKKATRSKKKNEPGQQTKSTPHQGKPKHYMPDTWGGGAPSAAAPPARAQTPPGISPPLPPLPSAGPPPTGTGQSYSSSLPLLPPAIPYTPPRAPGQSATRPIRPDSAGQVTATIPPVFPQGGTPGSPIPGASVAPVLPPGRQMGQSNPIDDFILDSFGGPRPQNPSLPPATAPNPQSMRGAPSPSLVDQVSRDVRELGQGIKNAFSRIVPLQ